MHILKAWSWVRELLGIYSESITNHNLVVVPELKFPHDKILIYIGCEDDQRITGIINNNLKQITDILSEHDCQFIFYPALINNIKNMTGNELASKLSYYLPEWHGKTQDLTTQIEGISPIFFYNSICLTYGVKNENRPLFLLSNANGFNGNSAINIYPIDVEVKSDSELINSITKIKYYNRSNSRNSISYYNPQEDNATKDGRVIKKRYNAEESFEDEASKISQEVANQIELLLNKGQNQILINIYHNLIEQTKLHSPELLPKFNAITSNAIGLPLSRLIVDSKYRILLPDYNNLEIELPPLPKTLYLFYLKYPEGVLLRDLVNYKNELLDIYNRITNSSSTAEIKKRIDDMTNMNSNSVNEKCSRIKEAFVVKMTDDIARNYYITGARLEVKRIELNQKYISYDH